MSNQKIPILSHFQIENCIFFDGQKCDFTKIPRPFHIVSEIKRGKAVFTSANKTITLKEGDVLLLTVEQSVLSLEITAVNVKKN